MKNQSNQPIELALRELMRKQNLTETGLAERIPVNQSTISRYLRRQRGRVLSRETVETISRIAEALDREPEYFLEVRIYRARLEVEQAMREGVVDLEDIRELVRRKRASSCRGGTGSESGKR